MRGDAANTGVGVDEGLGFVVYRPRVPEPLARNVRQVDKDSVLVE